MAYGKNNMKIYTDVVSPFDIRCCTQCLYNTRTIANSLIASKYKNLLLFIFSIFTNIFYLEINTDNLLLIILFISLSSPIAYVDTKPIMIENRIKIILQIKPSGNMQDTK